MAAEHNGPAGDGRAGGASLPRRGAAGEIVVLCYHAISESWPSPLAVTSSQLREQLEWLTSRGYRGATLSEAVGGRTRGRTVVVTFDDAFRSAGTVGFSVLTELGLPGTIFAVTDFADSSRALSWPGIDWWSAGPHAHELAGLSWTELAELSGAGWEVGSHTCSHPRLTQLDDRELAREVRDSRLAVERALGRPCRSLAFPYGDVDRRVVAAARAGGYEFAAALSSIPSRREPLTWPRIGIYRRDSLSRFKVKVSPTTRRTLAMLGRAQRATALTTSRRR